jgi:hypothetical protein
MGTETRSGLVLLSLAAGLAWIAGILLVSTQADSDPVGPHYDTYNRLLTPALVLLLASAFAFRRRVKQASAWGLMPLTIAVIGFGLYLVGNVVEFWGALLADQVSESAAARPGTDDFWQWSFPGFLIFLLGGMVVVVSLIAFAVRLGRWQGVSVTQRVAVGSAGILLTAATVFWAVSPLAALVPAVLFAFAWLVFANVVARRGYTSLGTQPVPHAPVAAAPERR